MKSNPCKFLFLFVLVHEVSYGYIDPGTGSALIYIVTGIIISIYFSGRNLFYKLFDYISGRKVLSEECNLAIHCEDPRYESTFLPVVVELAKREVDITFISMYERTEDFQKLPDNVKVKEIPEGIIGYSYLNKLKAKLLVTTTPQLDVMTFKRSEDVKEYIYVQHGLGESLYLKPFAYDHYDTILCCGSTLQENLRFLEEMRNNKKKLLLNTGIPHYDFLLSAAKDTVSEKPRVLVAPSWGEASLFKRHGFDFVIELSKKYDVTVRPHPQLRISQPDLYSELLNLQDITIDTTPALYDQINQADILISDFSGIIHEALFIFEKPVIVNDSSISLEPFEGYYIEGGSKIDKACSELIYKIDDKDINFIGDKVDEALEGFDREKLKVVRENLIYNFGNASKVAADQIEQRLSCN